MKIDKATDWQQVRADLKAQYPHHSPDLVHLLCNIDRMVAELSKTEVEARRRHKPELLEAELSCINETIEMVEHYIVMNLLSE